jgi:hypothetical protein
MILPFARVMSAALVTLALALVVASPVQAGPLDASRGKTEVGSNFLAGALNWLNGLLTGKALSLPRVAMNRDTPSGSMDSTEPVMHVQTGACIDPQGNPTVCVVEPDPNPHG